ncbi:unnamed protein product, partial [Prorocentrum cordatum]
MKQPLSLLLSSKVLSKPDSMGFGPSELQKCLKPGCHEIMLWPPVAKLGAARRRLLEVAPALAFAVTDLEGLIQPRHLVRRQAPGRVLRVRHRLVPLSEAAKASSPAEKARPGSLEPTWFEQ